MKKCSNNFDKCGNCSRCGECCAALIPMSRREEKRIRDYIKEHNIQPEFFQDGENINLQCCFYDRKNKVCKIYKVRPTICRSFKCDRNITDLENERDANHQVAYWNKISNNETKHLTDMRLLFYNDPRSLVSNMIFAVTKGTMKCTKEQFEFIKRYIAKCGQPELAKCLEGEFKN
jgi:Fe-S-cluster containining protein